MKAYLLFILFSICLVTSTFGQRQLTKEEIYSSWNFGIPRNNLDADSALVFDFDKQIYQQIIQFSDSLKASGIDSIIAYTIAYLGSNQKFDSCTIGPYPVFTYLIWLEKSNCYFKKFKGNCGFAVTKIPYSKIFDFYRTFDSAISREHFMPIIISGQCLENNQIQYTTTITIHEPNYSISYIMGQMQKTIRFAQSELEDKQSIFHYDNLKLYSYKWWTLIEREVAKE